MELNILLNKLKGIQTVRSVQNILKINRNKAIYYIYRLRKEGYVKTKRLNNGVRVYAISFENKLRGINYYEVINQYSPIKLSIPVTYQIYGREVQLEEVLVYAIKTKSFRTILASLSLFKKINDWNLLHYLGKKNNIERQIGVLYDLSRKLMRVRKMPKRFKNNALPKKNTSYAYIIQDLKSNEFPEIEKKWRVYIPFGKNDLVVYS